MFRNAIKQVQQAETISEEELGKVAGGTSPFCFVLGVVSFVATVAETAEVAFGS